MLQRSLVTFLHVMYDAAAYPTIRELHFSSMESLSTQQRLRQFASNSCKTNLGLKTNVRQSTWTLVEKNENVMLPGFYQCPH